MGVLREILDSREEKYFSITPTHEKHKNRTAVPGGRTGKKGEKCVNGIFGNRRKGESFCHV